MGKIMSVLEKYKLIEKEPESVPLYQDEAAKEILPGDEEIKEVDDYKEEYNEEENYTTEQIEKVKSRDRKLSLEEIYAEYNLKALAITDTVFVLEGLIKALPEELPEYVKKTTVDNIIAASAMNLEKLLADGNTRTTNLNYFIQDYTTQQVQDIATLKQEIDKLSSIINEYHQQIKHKEILLQEQTSLVKAEEARLQNIIKFFEK